MSAFYKNKSYSENAYNMSLRLKLILRIIKFEYFCKKSVIFENFLISEKIR